MALFGDKNKKTIEELESYYANREQKTGMAWVMAFLSLLLTVVILGGLFFGGRAVYRAVTDDGTPAPTAVTDEPVADNTSTTPTPEPSNSGSSTETPAPAPTPAASPTPTTGGVVSDQAASTTTPSTSTGAAARGGEGQNTSASGSVAARSTGLPNTGSGTILISAPIVTLIVGYFVARHKLIKTES